MHIYTKDKEIFKIPGGVDVSKEVGVHELFEDSHIFQLFEEEMSLYPCVKY